MNWRLSTEYRHDDRLVGEDPYGHLWACSRRERRRSDEPIFRIRFRRWNPRCWPAWFRSWRAGAMTWLDGPL